MSRSTALLRFWLATLTIALSTTVLLGVGTLAAQENRDEAAVRRTELSQRLDRLRAEVEAAQTRRDQLSDAIVDIAADDAKLAERMREVADRIGEMERHVARDERELEALTEKQAAIRQRLATARRRTATLLAALQTMGRQPPAALMADGGPVNVVRGAMLLNASLPLLAQNAAVLSDELAAVRRLEAEERDKWTRIREDLTELITERARLTALREEVERRRALSLYERDEAAAAVARLHEEADNVQSLLAALSEGAEPASQPSHEFAARRGRLPSPVAGRLKGRYGAPDGAGGLASGLTIEALPKSTVFAPMSSTVLYAAPFRSYGNVLILDAGDGYHMVLAGLGTVFVEVGDRLTQGAPVGRMGDRAGLGVNDIRTSRSGVDNTGPRRSAPSAAPRPVLYVELRKDGSAIDSHAWWRDPEFASGRTSG